MSTSSHLPFRYAIKGVSDLMSFSDEEIEYEIYKYNLYLSRGVDYKNITVLAFTRKHPPSQTEVPQKKWLKGREFEVLMKHIVDIFTINPTLRVQISGPPDQSPTSRVSGLQSLELCTFPDIQIVPRSTYAGLWNKVANVVGTLFIRNVVRFPVDFIRACGNMRGLHMDGTIDLIPSSHPWNFPPMVEDLVIGGGSALRCILEPFKTRPVSVPFINVARLQMLVIASKLYWRDPEMEGGLLNLVYQAVESLRNVYIFNTLTGTADVVNSLDRELPPLSIVFSFQIHETLNERWPTVCKLIKVLRGSTMRTLILELCAPFETRDDNFINVSSLAINWDALFGAFTAPSVVPLPPGINPTWELKIKFKFTRSVSQSAKAHHAAHIAYFNAYLQPALKRHLNITIADAVFLNYEQEPYFEIFAKLDATLGR